MSASPGVRPQTGQIPIAASGVRLDVDSLAVTVSDMVEFGVYLIISECCEPVECNAAQFERYSPLADTAFVIREARGVRYSQNKRQLRGAGIDGSGTGKCCRSLSLGAGSEA